MSLPSILTTLCMIAGIILLGLAILIAIEPLGTLSGLGHGVDQLPYVIAGRYAFMGILLFAAARFGDFKVLSFLLAALAGLGFIDAVIYWSSEPLPHLAAGGVAAFAGLLVFGRVSEGR